MMLSKPPCIGIVAPSSKVPQIELKLGVAKIREKGFLVKVHPQCKKSHLFFAGTDDERAQAFMEYAYDPEISVVWCARGGHGSLRLLPLLDQIAKKTGNPSKKLLMGYSDITALMEYVRREWGWSTLHAPMPSARMFSILGEPDWNALSGWIRREQVQAPWANSLLSFWGSSPHMPIEGVLVGGNLTVWNCLVGTSYQTPSREKILFFEDIDESLYRIDRMVQQLFLSRSLENVKAIVLGNFMNCKDYSPLILKSIPAEKSLQKVLLAPQPKELKLLRKPLEPRAGLKCIFSELGKKLGIPVAFGLPVGHGPGVSPLPLGANYRLLPQGFLELLSWDWLETLSESHSPVSGVDKGEYLR